MLPVNFVLVETPEYLQNLRFDGGHTALDFVNTLGGGHAQEPRPEFEHLRGYRDLLVWSVRAGTLAEETAGGLERAAIADPRQAARVLAEALELRDLAYAALLPIARGGAPSDADLRRLAERERDALEHAELHPRGPAYVWRWPPRDDLRLPLWPLAHATVELLGEGPLDRLKLCGECRWLFLDQSKNRSRRWCSMENCGTSVKMRRHSERRRGARPRA